MQIISAKDTIHISAPKEILINGGGSYLKIDAGGVEFGTTGNFTAHAANHVFTGPVQLPNLAIVPPIGSNYDEQVRVFDPDGKIMPNTPEVIRQAGGWGMGWAGFKIGGAIGATVTIETGPGAVIGGLVGGIIFGTAGYFGADWVADHIYEN